MHLILINRIHTREHVDEAGDTNEVHEDAKDGFNMYYLDESGRMNLHVFNTDIQECRNTKRKGVPEIRTHDIGQEEHIYKAETYHIFQHIT